MIILRIYTTRNLKAAGMGFDQLQGASLRGIYSKTSDEQQTMVQSKKIKVFFLTLRLQAGMVFDREPP